MANSNLNWSSVCGGLYSGEEIGALVFDIGSYSTRLGVAGEDLPKYDIPSAVAYDENYDEKKDTKKSKHSFGDVEIRVPREGVQIQTFLEDGMISNWDLFEALVDHVYAKKFCAASNEYPVLMSEPSWNLRAKREKVTEIMFEKYEIPGFYLAKSALLTAFASGRPTALVVDVGSKQTSVVPVYEGYVLCQGIVRSTLAGDTLIAESQKLLESMNIDLSPIYTVKSKEAVGPNEAPKWTKKTNLPNVTPSYHNKMMYDLLCDFNSQVVQIPETNYEDALHDNAPAISYEFPTGYNCEFGNERFRIGECLFDPRQLQVMRNAQGMLSVSLAVTTCVGMCDVDIRSNLYSSVIVTGGTTMLNGFTDRLQYELQRKIPPTLKLKMHNSQPNIQRRFSAWLGGSILGSLGCFHQLWISKQEYEESGKNCVERKCP